MKGKMALASCWMGHEVLASLEEPVAWQRGVRAESRLLFSPTGGPLTPACCPRPSVSAGCPCLVPARSTGPVGRAGCPCLCPRLSTIRRQDSPSLTTSLTTALTDHGFDYSMKTPLMIPDDTALIAAFGGPSFPGLGRQSTANSTTTALHTTTAPGPTTALRQPLLQERPLLSIPPLILEQPLLSTCRPALDFH